ncbi:MAG: triose-phosphate isomerase [Proteobacteria bacterium]|nr:triose-phosphate isomerase [Pseudomonadota bacterium]
MRKPFIAGNWKMNKTMAEAAELASSIADGLSGDIQADVAVIPPFLAIPKVAAILSGSPIIIGAQDVYFEKSGAFTGEISCQMLADAGCEFALVGHSERRHVLGETDELIRKKLDALLESGLKVILCVGEKLEERESGMTEERLAIQIRAGLNGVSPDKMGAVTVAYEPVWAIGTGKTATKDQAQEAHLFVRGLLEELFDKTIAQSIRIQYGGSVKPGNAKELMAEPDVDGALIGGASLDANSFLGIIKAS